MTSKAVTGIAIVATASFLLFLAVNLMFGSMYDYFNMKYNQTCFYEVCGDRVCNSFPLHPLVCEELPYNCHIPETGSFSWELDLGMTCRLVNETVDTVHGPRNSTICTCTQSTNQSVPQFNF